MGLEVHWLLVCQPLREAQEDQYDPEEKENGRYEEVWKEGGEIEVEKNERKFRRGNSGEEIQERKFRRGIERREYDKDG